MASFIEQIKEKAKKERKRIVLPEPDDKRTLYAADAILKEGLAEIVLVGDEQDIASGEKWLEIDLSGAKIINPKKTDLLDKYTEVLYETRKEKGMTPEQAREKLLNDKLTFGVTMVKANDADGMVAGACHATSDTLRPALQILKTAPGVKLVSGFFVVVVPDCKMGDNGVFIFADSGLNQDPDPDQLAEIAHSSAKSFQGLIGDHPEVAMLSHSTKGSAKHPLVDKVTEAVRIAHERYPNLDLDGELQLDAAIVPEVAKLKAPGSTVAGHANVLVFPNLDAGNIGYKLVQRLGKAEAYGPMLQGIAKPVNDLSRGCSWEDIVGVVALTAVQCQIS
ncbi:MAG: phosphate acetyltransferase [Lachnospiraceae bacterium]|nr:phosphate acetyltransferase [Lachnospiraceae bacterium]